MLDGCGAAVVFMVSVRLSQEHQSLLHKVMMLINWLEFYLHTVSVWETMIACLSSTCIFFLFTCINPQRAAHFSQAQPVNNIYWIHNGNDFYLFFSTYYNRVATCAKILFLTPWLYSFFCSGVEAVTHLQWSQQQPFFFWIPFVLLCLCSR